ncbi:MAG: efflux RND transporter permease subunit [Rikenellaceae bacterium]
MNIYETAVKKPISTILIFVGIMVMGLFSLINLAVDQYPEIDVPVISVITYYPGANASDVETNITRVLEDNLNTVDDLKELTSTSSDNYSIVSLEFEYGIDLSEAANDIRDVVSRTQSLLPDDVDYPTIFKFSSSMMPVIMFAITADESYQALDKILDDEMVNVLNRINGVGSVSVIAAPAREIQVNIDPRKADAYGLTVESIGAIIGAENVNIPAGTIDLGNSTFNIKSDGEFEESSELRDIIVANHGGRVVRLSDVAQIKDTLETSTMDERINGRQGVRVMVQKQSGANTVSIVNAINEAMPAIGAALPSDVDVTTIYESATEVNNSINSLSETIMYAFIFVILVVMTFLGRWRATFIICLTIPISLICSFVYLYATGSTLNIISLSSLSIAIGMVVDDAIVVLENITTHIEKGSSPKEAAIYGTNEVWLSVIATTLVVVAVFLPLTMLSGMAGILFRELGWIVTIVVCVSTAAAITLTPMLSAYILSSKGGEHDYKGLGIVYKPIDKTLDWLDRTYAKMLRVVLAHRLITMTLVALTFVGSLAIMGSGKIPTEFFPSNDNDRMSAVVKMEQNVSVEYTAKIARQIDNIIYDKYPEIIVVSASAGANSSSDAYSAMTTTGSHIINYTLRFVSADERDRSIFEIADLLREDLDKIPEVRDYSVTPGGSSGPSGATTADIKIIGHDMDLTNVVATEIKDLARSVSGLRDVQLSREDLRPELDVKFDREKLSQYGITYYSAAYAVRNRINGLTASVYREDGDEYDIVVRYDEQYRTALSDVENITLTSVTGRQIPLKNVATITTVDAAPSIERENRQRIVSVQGSLGDGVALSDVTGELQAIIDNYDVPDGVFLEVGGTIEDQQESFSDLMLLFVLIVILVYIVMATQFESLLFPFIIMFTIPLAFTGVILALYISGTTLSIIALIGAIMLVGIVTKNGIVMVDYMNLLVERGSTVYNAVIDGGNSRLRPVLMTSFTTILGMMPMALSSDASAATWRPMGIAVIGGLTFSTMLTLLVVPVFYSVFVNHKIKRDLKKHKQAEAEMAELEANL